MFYSDEEVCGVLSPFNAAYFPVRHPSLSAQVRLDCFHTLLESHVPHCAVRGQNRLSHSVHDINVAWQLEADTDWAASVPLSVFLSLHVTHLRLLKSVY